MRIAVGLALVMLGGPALGQTAPSTMGAASGNTGAANNGTGTAGSLTGPNGTHSSVVTSTAEIGDKTSHPTPAASATSPGDAKLEKDPTQGAGSSPPTAGSAPSPK